MSIQSRRSWKAVAVLAPGLLVGLLLVGGCGQGLGKMVPVEGQVSVDGAPLPGDAEVTFIPENTRTQATFKGKVETNGKYKMTTNGKDGVPAGKYKVLVTTNASTVADPSQTPGKTPPLINLPAKKFNAKYESGLTSDLTIDVPAGNYDLKLSRR